LSEGTTDEGSVAKGGCLIFSLLGYVEEDAAADVGAVAFDPVEAPEQRDVESAGGEGGCVKFRHSKARGLCPVRHCSGVCFFRTRSPSPAALTTRR